MKPVCCAYDFNQERIAKEKKEREEAKKIPHLSNLNEDAGLTGKLQHLCMPGELGFSEYCSVFLPSVILRKLSLCLKV